MSYEPLSLEMKIIFSLIRILELPSGIFSHDVI